MLGLIEGLVLTLGGKVGTESSTKKSTKAGGSSELRARNWVPVPGASTASLFCSMRIMDGSLKVVAFFTASVMSIQIGCPAFGMGRNNS